MKRIPRNVCAICGSSRLLLKGGGLYLPRRKHPKWVCVAKSCPSHRAT